MEVGWTIHEILLWISSGIYITRERFKYFPQRYYRVKPIVDKKFILDSILKVHCKTYKLQVKQPSNTLDPVNKH